MTNIVVNRQVSKVIVATVVTPALIVVNKGEKGDSGDGVPVGGTTGQVLTKTSNSDFAVNWQDNPKGDLLASNNLSDVANIDTARENLKAASKIESIVNAFIFG